MKSKLADSKAYTLLELLVVLVIVGTLLGLGVFAISRFRQVILVSNTAKEIQLNLSQARRYAINNVLTSDGKSPEGYYLEILNNDYSLGSCEVNSAGSTVCSASNKKSVKSDQYNGVEVSIPECPGVSIIKFTAVTGEFVFSNNPTISVGSTGVCQIEVKLSGIGGTIKRFVEVDTSSRTIKIKT